MKKKISITLPISLFKFFNYEAKYKLKSIGIDPSDMLIAFHRNELILKVLHEHINRISQEEMKKWKK